MPRTLTAPTRRWPWLASALLLAACDPGAEAALFRVDRVEPDRLVPGSTVRVRGEGFPAGRTVDVRLRGSLHSPGRPPRPIELGWQGVAVSSSRLDVALDADDLPDAGAEGTLHGVVEVRVPSAGRRGLVVGRSSPLRLDLSPDPRHALRPALARQRRGSRLVAALGVRVGETRPGTPGLPIVAVEGGSAAAAGGLVAGDRVVEANGVRVADVGDLLPPPGADELALEALRPGAEGPVTLHVPLPGHADPVTRFARAFLAGWTLIVLLLFAPTASALDLGRRVAPAAARTAPRRTLPLALAGLAFLVAGALLARALPVGAYPLVLALAAARVGAAWLWSSGRSAGARVEAVLGATLAGLAVLAGVVGLSALTGTDDVAALQALQALGPSRWTAFASPAGLALAGLVGLGAAFGPRHERGGDEPGRRLGRAVDRGAQATLAALIAALFLGGLPRAVEHPLLFRVVAFAVQASVVLALLVAMEGRLHAGSRSARAAVALVAVALVLGGAVLAHDGWALHPTPEAPVLAAGAGIAALVTRLRTLRPRPAPSVAHPLL
ncbi:MAG: hypothetical protein ACFCGT_12545 [Sandaracinaceae bacterium]